MYANPNTTPLFFSEAKEAGFRIKELGQASFGTCVFTPECSPLHITPELLRFSSGIFELIELYGLEYVKNGFGLSSKETVDD